MAARSEEAPPTNAPPVAAEPRRFVNPEPVSEPPAVAPAPPVAPPAEPVTVDSPIAPPPPVFAPPPGELTTPPRRGGRRNWLKLATWAGVIFAALAIGIIAAVSYFGVPDWVPIARPVFALAQPDLQLDFPPAQQERRQLPNGTEFFGASGTITNTGGTARSVPPILIVLRDAHDRIVYTWEVKPPKPSLAPGESANVNEAVTDVPRSAKVAEIGWKPE